MAAYQTQKNQSLAEPNDDPSKDFLLQPGLALALLRRPFRRPLHGAAGPDRHHLPVQTSVGPADVRRPAQGPDRRARPERRRATAARQGRVSQGRDQQIPAACRQHQQRAIRDAQPRPRSDRLRRPVSRQRPRRAGRQIQPASHRPRPAWRVDDRHRRRSPGGTRRRLGRDAGGVGPVPVVAARQVLGGGAVAALQQSRPGILARYARGHRFLGSITAAGDAAQRHDLDRLLGQAIR